MSGIARFSVMVAGVLSLLAVLSSSAGAVTYHNSGSTAFTAVNANAGTFSVTGVSFTCTGADATGTSPAASFVGTTYTVAVGTLGFTGCSFLGIPTSLHCSYSQTTSGLPDGTSPLRFTGNMDLACSMAQFGAEICKIEGQTAVSYTNPVSPSTFGRFLFSHSATLRTTNGSAGSCPMGAGDPLTLTTQTFTITSATGGPAPSLGPVITRTT